MKMAETADTLAVRSNGDDFSTQGNAPEKEITETADSDITNETNTNKPSDKPKQSQQEVAAVDNLDLLSQEAAVDEFLAGNSKNAFSDDMLMSNMGNEEDAIDFKQDNELEGCEQLVQNVFDGCSASNKELIRELKRRAASYNKRPHWWLLKSLRKRSIKYLNKMHVMEDVREGCDIQPSSPGHAEQEPKNEESQKSPKENGEKDICVSDNKVELQEIDTSVVKQEDNGSDSKDGDNDTPEENLKERTQAAPTVENGSNNINEDSLSNDSGSADQKSASSKRKLDIDESLIIKKLRTEIQENYTLRDKILNEYMNLGDCSTLEQIQTYTEQILAEIRTLNDLAKEKEREWNNIIHLKKLKEELLIRIQRRKHVLTLNSDKNETEVSDSHGDVSDERSNCVTSGTILKSSLCSKGATLKIPHVNQDKGNQQNYNSHRSLLNSALEMNGQSADCNKQGRQRPVLDVQSIIADYRQRHPEAVPRRGRRIRSVLNMQNDNGSSNGKMNSGSILNFSSVALGTGSQVRQNLTTAGFDVNSELGLLLSAMDNANANKSSGADSSNPAGETSFRDMLVQFAKLSQSERHELIQNAIRPPPPYPEVTVHPVSTSPQPQTPTNSLLHGILTKSQSKPNNKTSFSPTLARLLTAPERAAINNSHSAHTQQNAVAAGNVSITDLLSTSKARNEITITPVGQFDNVTKEKSTGHAEEDEAEDSADRLVIDESTEAAEARNRSDNNSDIGDEVPQCQGCNQRQAQFVCAGCGNQWYCSRECQVSAWDEHSEVCSG